MFTPDVSVINKLEERFVDDSRFEVLLKFPKEALPDDLPSFPEDIFIDSGPIPSS